jgi:hypothetical protein
MVYISYIKRDYQQQDHTRCSIKICLVNQIDEGSYETQHKTQRCQCSHVEPDQEEIRKIIRRGEVPIISLVSKIEPNGSRTVSIIIGMLSLLDLPPAACARPRSPRLCN